MNKPIILAVLLASTTLSLRVGADELLVISPTSGPAPLTVNFKIGVPADQLDWGDGGGQGACSPVPCTMSTLYNTPGQYTVKLERFDGPGKTGAANSDGAQYMKKVVLATGIVTVMPATENHKP